jgi:hypothetical protein
MAETSVFQSTKMLCTVLSMHASNMEQPQSSHKGIEILGPVSRRRLGGKISPKMVRYVLGKGAPKS